MRSEVGLRLPSSARPHITTRSYHRPTAYLTRQRRSAGMAAATSNASRLESCGALRRARAKVLTGRLRCMHLWTGGLGQESEDLGLFDTSHPVHEHVG
jgi:hypothetical protein